MSVLVNGALQPLPQPATLDALLARLAPRRPFSVAHNEDFVPRDTYEQCRLEPGDRIEIVHPSAGG